MIIFIPPKGYRLKFFGLMLLLGCLFGKKESKPTKTKIMLDEDHYISFVTDNPPSPKGSLQIIPFKYHSPAQSYILCETIPLDFMYNIQKKFELLTQNKLSLPEQIPPFKVGLVHNYLKHAYWTAQTEEEQAQYDYSGLHNYSLCWIPGIQTWIYNVNNSIALEIAPSYEWDMFNPENNQVIPTFETFISLYKPFAIHIIQKEEAQEWLNMANNYCEIVGQKFKELTVDKAHELGLSWDRDCNKVILQ